ncbi:MAG: YvcK family protein [Acidobacteria bacterium]|nr:YvcK family protein [Acidobacteriota bacterium]MCA1638020.1 YvcK family protein [Acidobacteriota bacterium]
MKNHSFPQNSFGLNCVAIGGGNGLATLLSGLKKFVSPSETESVWLNKLSAIVAVSDDGGSSGRLRDELKMPPPGDIRNCMVALSEDSHLLSKLFQYRFRGVGDLGGHSFGNLFLAALSEVTGDFAEAVRLSSEILASKGHIYPATTADVRLAAELVDGSVVRGETNISKVGNSIKRLRLEPENCPPLPEVLAAICEADIITIGPGSLFTSLLPPILVDGLAQAIDDSAAVKIFVCNLMTQPGETDDFSAKKHLETVREHAPIIDFDYVIVNNYPISGEQKARYASEGARQIGISNSILLETVEGAEILYGNLLEGNEKVRHHPDKLAQVILHCAVIKKNVTAAQNA